MPNANREYVCTDQLRGETHVTCPGGVRRTCPGGVRRTNPNREGSRDVLLLYYLSIDYSYGEGDGKYVDIEKKKNIRM